MVSKPVYKKNTHIIISIILEISMWQLSPITFFLFQLNLILTNQRHEAVFEGIASLINRHETIVHILILWLSTIRSIRKWPNFLKFDL